MSRYATEMINREALDIVRRMALIAEYREPDIKKHLERVRGYCSVLAHGLGLSSQEVEIISYASQLHDIGEVSIPEAILTKSGNLTDNEWELVKRHPIIGAEILHGSISPVLQAGEIIALTHHERWNGSGYPYGIKEEEIPLSGRICALADVFDALTTQRPYKQPIPVSQGGQLILDSSGQLFDPKLVEVFADNIEEITKIRQLNL